MAALMISLVLFASAAAAALVLVLRRFLNPFKRPGVTLTPLRGPPRTSPLFGVTRLIRLSPNPREIYATWVKEYGSVFRIPLPFGSEAIVVTDPKAVAHIFGKDTFVYVKTPGLRVVTERVIGKGVLWVEGEDHRKQRKALNLAFSPGAIKNMTPVSYDTVYRLKAKWDKLLESSTTGAQVELDMHEWTMKLTLDTVGRAVFGHDFHTLEGNYSTVEEALHVFNTTIPSKLGMITYAASIFVPWIGNLPTKRNTLFKNLSDSAHSILENLLSAKATEKEDPDIVGMGRKRQKSLIELLIDAEDDGLSLESAKRKKEIVTQMKAILIAASDPPGLVLVWALIELSRRPAIQARIRAEVNSAPGVELDWNRLQSACPYLDAFISEVLRLRPSFGETPRVTNEDDILQLKQPIMNASGELIDKIFLPKGTKVIIPNHFMNTAPDLWGTDAVELNPDRWIRQKESISGKEATDEMSASNGRFLSFGQGPRVCVGKAFATAQLKIVLAVLLREYSFALPQGPDTAIDFHYSLIARPKVRGQVGAKLPLLISRAR